MPSAVAERALPCAEALARAYLRERAAAVAARGPAADTRIIYDETAAAILQEAASRPAALIAMATHGHAGLDRLAYGSVAAVVRGALPGAAGARSRAC